MSRRRGYEHLREGTDYTAYLALKKDKNNELGTISVNDITRTTFNTNNSAMKMNASTMDMTGFVSSIALYPQYRGKQLGKTLLSRFHHHLTSLYGVRESHLHCRVSDMCLYMRVVMYVVIFGMYICIRWIRRRHTINYILEHIDIEYHEY